MVSAVIDHFHVKPMQLTGFVLFAVAAIFYIRTLKYVHQLVKEVNQKHPERPYASLGWWSHRREQWRLHSQFYPSSSVRKQIGWNIALTLTFWFIMTLVFVRWFFATHH